MSEHTLPLQTEPQPSEQRASEQRATGGWHPVNVGHLVMGVAFLGLALVLSLIATDVVDGDDKRWLLPLPWVAAGLAGVVASLLPSRRRRHETRQRGWVDPTPKAATDPAPEPATEPATEPADDSDENPTDETPEETR